MKSFSLTVEQAQTQKEWYVVDATDVVLGRLASALALILRGKHKATYTPNVDCGDNVIVINAEKVALTGKKLQNDILHWHTGYPGGVKSRSQGQILAGRYPERVIEKAVERMISKGPLGSKQLTNLKVYVGPNHPHDAQKPKVLDIAGRNKKNKRNA